MPVRDFPIKGIWIILHYTEMWWLGCSAGGSLWRTWQASHCSWVSFVFSPSPLLFMVFLICFCITGENVLIWHAQLLYLSIWYCAIDVVRLSLTICLCCFVLIERNLCQVRSLPSPAETFVWWVLSSLLSWNVNKAFSFLDCGNCYGGHLSLFTNQANLLWLLGQTYSW